MQLALVLFNIPVFQFAFESGKNKQQKQQIGFNQINKE